MLTILCVMQPPAPIRPRWVLHGTHSALKRKLQSPFVISLPDWMTNQRTSKVHVRDKMTTDGQKLADADGEIWLILGGSAQFQIEVFTGSAVARCF